MDAETAFHFVGTFGKYQFGLCLLFFLGNFISALQMVLMVVVGFNVSEINEYHNMTTIVTDFDLHDRMWIVDLMQSLMMAGYIAGCLIFGQLSDSYGRKIPLLIGAFGGGITGFCSGLATNWQTFAVTRFLTGAFIGGGGVTMFVLMTEILGKRAWAAAGLIYQTFFSLGICFLALLGYLIPKWQTVCMVSGGMVFGTALLFLIFLPESPRWLYSTGKTEKSEKILRTIAQRNGRDSRSIYLSPAASGHATTNTFIDLFRHRKLIIWITATCFVWFANGLVYYGLTLSAGNLNSDLYIGIILSGAIEIPANIICIFLMDFKWIGRRGALLLLFGICGIANIISIFTYEYATAKLILTLGSKLVIAGAFNVVYVYTGEVFPTSLRSVAIGASSTAARIGAIVSPFMTVQKSDGYAPNEYVPFLVYGVTSIVSVGVLFFLPKTLGKPVPQTIEEVVNSNITYKHLINENEVNANMIADIDIPNGNPVA